MKHLLLETISGYFMILREAVDVHSAWADSEMDWKLAEWTGPEGGDQQNKI